MPNSSFRRPVAHANRAPTLHECNNRMNFARIMPGPPVFDLRSFECDRCDHVVTVTVATDPMKSEKTIWQHSELKPPK